MSGFTYFKVSEDILSIDIKKSELWVYLTHCRSRGNKSKGFSIASLNAVRKFFGNSIGDKTYNKSISSLIDKGLITKINIKDKKIYTGYYKVDTAIEIVVGKKNIQLPIELLDENIITNLKLEEIKDIIKLYSLYEPLENFGGLDYESISAINNVYDKGLNFIFTFGERYNRSIYKRKGYIVEPPNEYKSSNQIVDIDKYIDMKLFKLKPVILEYDEEDNDLAHIKYEVFEFLVKKDHKYITSIEKNQRAIFVIEPVYPVKNVKYREYLNNREKARIIAVEIYSNFDVSTDREGIFSLISNGSLERFIEDHILEREEIPVNAILSLINEISSLLIKQDLDYSEVKDKKNLLKEMIKEEEKNIEDYNNDITESTGKRSRYTTSARLKTLESKFKHYDITLEEANHLLDELLFIMPKWIISKLNEIDYDYF